MDIKKMNIHLFKTREQCYIYDVGTNGILCIDKDVYEYMEQVRKNKRQADDPQFNNEIETIRKENYLSEDRVKNIEHPATSQLPKLLETRLNSITLQVTQQCNLRCKYCAYSGSYHNRIHADKNMSKELAFKGVDYIIEQGSLAPTIFIGFYGGEPLLRFDLIKDVVEYANEKSGGKCIQYHMTTNGTLLTEEVTDFLVKQKFGLLISLDGPAEIHDDNRIFAGSEKGSYKAVIKHLERIEERYPEYYTKCISFNCVMDGHHDYRLIHQYFNYDKKAKDWRVNSTLVSNRYAKEEDQYDLGFVEEYTYQRFLALLGAINRVNGKHVSKLMKTELLDMKDKYYKRKMVKGINETDHPGGPCIPGVRKLFMDVKGDFYPCERVSECSSATHLGNIDEGISLEQAKKILNIGKLTEEQCKNCWAYRYCTMCVAHVDDLNELSTKLKLSRCQNTRETVESHLRNYCTLREFDCTFDNII